jgi:hypothetical protein
MRMETGKLRKERRTLVKWRREIKRNRPRREK